MSRASSFMVRNYFWSERQHRRAQRLLNAVFTGFWLGVLTSAQGDAIADEYYAGGGVSRSDIDYRNLAFNRSGLTAWERRAIEDHLPVGQRVVVLGAGGGREVLALRRRGHDAIGWEIQATFVDAANELLQAEGFPPSVHLVQRSVVPLVTEPFEAAIIGWSVYTLILGRDSRRDLLGDLSACLEPGAPLLVSYFRRTAGERWFRIASNVANVARRLRRAPLVEIGDWLQPLPVHFFTDDELRQEFEDAGFEVVVMRPRPYAHAVVQLRGGDDSGR